ncbi:unnamed protein product [Cyprideis torosa]|uniref:Uncharacterized protein n=1 Tax=Cyprideis torosa TaxID=163714 RepID=A0A7R8WGQ5_9CRUS|nr:unnamed protein product [Cyprideis torosa]CAG0895609.1 unnamed protein product [Cyprideis torosa]
MSSALASKLFAKLKVRKRDSDENLRQHDASPPIPIRPRARSLCVASEAGQVLASNGLRLATHAEKCQQAVQRRKSSTATMMGASEFLSKRGAFSRRQYGSIEMLQESNREAGKGGDPNSHSQLRRFRVETGSEIDEHRVYKVSREKGSWHEWERFLARVGKVPGASGKGSWHEWERFLARVGKVPDASGKGSWREWERFLTRVGKVPDASGKGSWREWERFQARVGKVPGASGKGTWREWERFLMRVGKVPGASGKGSWHEWERFLALPRLAARTPPTCRMLHIRRWHLAWLVVRGITHSTPSALVEEHWWGL